MSSSFPAPIAPGSLPPGYQIEYLEQLYSQWLADPTSVDASWAWYFEGFRLASGSNLRLGGGGAAAGTAGAGSGRALTDEQANAQTRVANLIHAYRAKGHLIANLDPLGYPRAPQPDLDTTAFGFTESDYSRTFDTGELCAPQQSTLGDIIDIVRETYCGSIGVEYMHMRNDTARRWLQERMEPLRNRPPFTRERKLEILESLTNAELFETFTHTRFPGQKRFSLEGGESLIPALRNFVELCPEVGVEEVVIGMAHRGRLNVLVNILEKSYATVFAEFEDSAKSTFGDVKYHKGYSTDRRTTSGKTVHVSLSFNPSHLEAVGSVVLGRVRAKQRQRMDTDRRKKVCPIIIHGDASIAGQGVVAETFNLMHLDGFTVGGTIHIVINNQIGFTTGPEDSRSTRYCTDIAKMVEAPIFHVNGDDPEAMAFVMDLALRFRQEFGCDPVVDMICFRRHGHNESDEPNFTQPEMYKRIRAHETVRNIYMKRLIADKHLSEADGQRLAAQFQERLQAAFERVKNEVVEPEVRAFKGLWSGLGEPWTDSKVQTGVASDTLRKIGRALTTVPEGFVLNPKIERTLPARWKAIDTGEGPIDWGFAELLAYGSLLGEGVPVRLTGQDVMRGTFSHRHATWWDMETQRTHEPLNTIGGGQAKFCVHNSPLTEGAVLGFEWGYALNEPRMLILWEAQFGDFCNGAQTIIDQFVVSSEVKWNRTNGLVLLLPHGFEGQGPEHSSGYLERFLSLCAEDNIQVCNATTPANYFHLLRRQMKRPLRRPLIVMTPKSLLRSEKCVSTRAEFESGYFREILDDPTPAATTRRLVLCSGKLYYELAEARAKAGAAAEGVSIVRVEQLYPWSERAWGAVIEKYGKAEEIVWAQEEPKNRGAWSFIEPRLREVFAGRTIHYAGRKASASPATGSPRLHKIEQKELIDLAITGSLARPVVVAVSAPAAAATPAANGAANGANGAATQSATAPAPAATAPPGGKIPQQQQAPSARRA